jgi:hypothetical protein
MEDIILLAVDLGRGLMFLFVALAFLGAAKEYLFRQ